jgi:hypothetical protein
MLFRGALPCMPLPQPNCRRVTPLTLCGLALGLLVVLWGAGYKMAQYPQGGCAFRVMVPAKLLTEKERPERATDSRVILTSKAGLRGPLRHLSAGITCVCRSALRAEPCETFVPFAHRRKIVRAELTYFSFRPPPRFTS